MRKDRIAEKKKSGPGAADRSANARTVILPAIITHIVAPETSGVNSPNFFPEHGKEKGSFGWRHAPASLAELQVLLSRFDGVQIIAAPRG
jgi:hypothetical protein